MNRWAYDEQRERAWQRQIRECLIRECLDRPDYWRPIIQRWRERQRPGIDRLVADLRAAWQNRG